MKFIIFIIVVLFVIGCSTDRPAGQTEAEVLYKEAQQLIADGHYIQATEYLNQIKSQYPYSFYSTHADLLQADILFMQENFVESAAAYILFKDFHPKHPQIPYVIWRIGESYFLQIPSTFDRDLAPAHEAISYFKLLKSKYPNSENISEADKKMLKAKEMIESKEKYIADFYFKTGSFRAARFRYLDIIKNFDNAELRDYAKQMVITSSIQIKDKSSCNKYSAEFITNVSSTSKNIIKELSNKCQNL